MESDAKIIKQSFLNWRKKWYVREQNTISKVKFADNLSMYFIVSVDIAIILPALFFSSHWLISFWVTAQCPRSLCKFCPDIYCTLVILFYFTRNKHNMRTLS